MLGIICEAHKGTIYNIHIIPKNNTTTFLTKNNTQSECFLFKKLCNDNYYSNLPDNKYNVTSVVAHMINQLL